MNIAHPAQVSCPEAAAGDPLTVAARARSRAERLSREARGIALYEERGADVQQVGKGLYSVPSGSGRHDYLVHYDALGESCECRDFEFGYICKHLYAVALFAAKRRRVVRTMPRCSWPMTAARASKGCG